MLRIPTLIILLAFTVIDASAQQKTSEEKTDSIVALLPRLSGAERMSALATLMNLSAGLSTQKQFTYQYLDEARRQKDVKAESAALLKLTLYYYPYLREKLREKLSQNENGHYAFFFFGKTDPNVVYIL